MPLTRDDSLMQMAEALQRAEALAGGPRRLLGLTGPPGAGKSTLAETLSRHLGSRCAVVGMDGFHLSNQQLARLGRADRKGAPDTFDVAGYVSLLARLRVADADVYAPVFHREIEESIAAELCVPAGVPLVITEGNYLLLTDGGWQHVRPLLDECWYVDLADEVRVERLIARHVAHGRSPDAAREWVLRSDEANARLAAATRDLADWVVAEPR